MIYANWREAPAELITPQEITEIMRRAGTVEDINRALAVANEYIKQNAAPAIKIEWDLLCMLSNIYQAGRLQGIREQKAKYAAKGIDHTHTHTQANGVSPFAVRMEGGSMRAKAPFTGSTPTAADKAAVDNIMLSLFFAWQDEITAPGAKRDMEPLKPFMEITGAGASSGLCIMYEAFINGVNAGLELAQTIDRIAAEANRG